MKGGREATAPTITTPPYTSAAESWAHHHDDGGGWGLSWPPRFYTCNFCKREFKSAQALGGHMNVHRRDRARLRGVHSPKPLTSPNPNPNFNPNPNNPNPNNPNPNNPNNFNPNPNPAPPCLALSGASPSTPHNRLLAKYKHPGRSVSPKRAAIFEPTKLLVMRRQENLISKTKGRRVVDLGLEIGIFDHDYDHDDDEEDDDEDLEAVVGLDLELRLGYNH